MKKSLAISQLLGSIVTLSIILTSCGSENKNAAKDESQSEEIILVKTAASDYRNIEQGAEFSGTVDPMVLNNISSAMSMRINKINVEIGDKVRKGQTLVEMDPLQLLQAKVQLSNLETDYIRSQKLYEQGGVSKQQLDQMATQLDVTRHSTQNLEDNTTLISPINGIITDRTYDAGDIYSPGVGKILTVMEVDRVKVKLNVSEKYFPQIKQGMPVNVNLDVYPNETFSGKVTLIHPSIDPSSRSFGLEITIPNPKMKLRPGMFAKVRLNFGSQERVLIPDIAVIKQAGSAEKYVFVVDDSNTARRRTVQLGQVIGSEYEIISGVSKGERVVIAGSQKLLDGSKVRTN